jgi:hypothetical protein
MKCLHHKKEKGGVSADKPLAPQKQKGRYAMRRFTGMLLVVAVALLAGLESRVEACYCGAARYAVCRRACCTTVTQPCYTVMKTCPQVVYQQRQYTCYRTCYEPVREQKTVTAVRYVSETKFRECVETVCRPVYETAQRDICYTVCKPVRTVQTVKVCGGHWETREVACCAPKACDPCAPAIKTVQQCRVWVPEIVAKQVECVKYVPETVTKKVPYTVCRMVTDQRVRQVPYTVCKAVPYQTTVPCVRYVAKQVPYTVTRCEPQVVNKQVAVQVCCPAASCCGN